MNCLNVCWSLEAIALILSGTHVDTHITPHMQQHTIRGDSCLSVQILRFNLGQNVPKKKKGLTFLVVMLSYVLVE